MGTLKFETLWAEESGRCREVLARFNEQTVRQKDITLADLLGNKNLLQRV